MWVDFILSAYMCLTNITEVVDAYGLCDKSHKIKVCGLSASSAIYKGKTYY